MSRRARRNSRWRDLLTGPRLAIRTVEVLAPSERDEEAWVFLTSCFVCLCVIYIFAFQLYRPPDAKSDRSNETLAYQVLFRDLPGKEQRVFRLMQEGLEEAMRVRGASGQWPTVESLAAMGIPPFAPDVLDKSSLVWSQQHDGLIAEYFGVPAAGTDMPSFLILVQEPPPTGGEDPLAGGVDEEHQLLPDRKLLHVTYWKHWPVARRSDLVVDPPFEGWVQIRITSPFKVSEES